MGEKLNIVVFLEKANLLHDKKEMVDQIFFEASPWLNKPGVYYWLNWENNFEKTGMWSKDAEILSNLTIDVADIITIYDEDFPKNLLSIQQAGNNIEYSLSIEIEQIKRTNIDTFEDWLINLYRIFSDIKNHIIIVGSEISFTDLSEETSKTDVFNYGLKWSSSCIWIVSRGDVLLEENHGFSISKNDIDDVVLFTKRAAIPYIWESAKKSGGPNT